MSQMLSNTIDHKAFINLGVDDANLDFSKRLIYTDGLKRSWIMNGLARRPKTLNKKESPKSLLEITYGSYALTITITISIHAIVVTEV